MIQVYDMASGALIHAETDGRRWRGREDPTGRERRPDAVQRSAYAAEPGLELWLAPVGGDPAAGSERERGRRRVTRVAARWSP
jgi:hypothetical protein